MNAGLLKNVKNILVIRLDRVGDLILSTPFFYNLRKMYSEANISAVVRPYTKDVLTNNPNIDEILIFNNEGKLKEKVGFIKKLRKTRWDLAISLSPVTSSYIMTFLSGAVTRVSYVYSDRIIPLFLTSLILNVRPVLNVQSELKKGNGVTHEVRQTFSVLKALGGSPEEVPLKLFGYEDIQEANPRLIGIHLSPKWFTENWNYGDFDSMAEKILESCPCHNLLVTYGKQEEYLVDKISCIRNNRVVIKGGSSFCNWANDIAATDLFISTDTGALHCAVALGKKVVAVYEDFTFEHCSTQWAPWMVKNEVVRKKKSNKTIDEIVEKTMKLL